MLGAEVYMSKVRKTEAKTMRKKNFQIKTGGKSEKNESFQGSQENVGVKKSKENDLKEEIIIGVDNLIEQV